MVSQTIEIPQLLDWVVDVPVVQVVWFHRSFISPSWRRGSFPWSRLFVGSSRFPSSLLTCRLWMRQSFSHSSCSLRKSLRSPDVDDIPVVAQVRLPVLLQTIEIHVDVVIDVPGLRVQRVPRVPSWRRQSSSHGCTR